MNRDKSIVDQMAPDAVSRQELASGAMKAIVIQSFSPDETVQSLFGNLGNMTDEMKSHVTLAAVQAPPVDVQNKSTYCLGDIFCATFFSVCGIAAMPSKYGYSTQSLPGLGKIMVFGPITDVQLADYVRLSRQTDRAA